MTIKGKKIKTLEAVSQQGKMILKLQRVWGGWVVNRYDYICVSYVHWDED